MGTRSLVPLAVALALFVAPTAIAAEPVAIGEVSSTVTRADVDVSAVLRALATAELRLVDVSRVPRNKSAIASVALVKLETRATANGSTAACVVSVVLRDRKRGNIVALLEGRARAEDGARYVPRAEQSAMQGAVRGALSRIPEALR